MTRKYGAAFLTALVAGLLVPTAVATAAETPSSADAARRCTNLARLRLADTTIESAALVPAKAAELGIADDKPGYRSFCRVVARVRSAPDSDIGVEIWLPTERWAGVFHGNGNGGFAGAPCRRLFGNGRWPAPRICDGDHRCRNRTGVAAGR